MSETAKVFKINNCDWWAGTSLAECVKRLSDEMGEPEDEIVDDSARQVTEEEMDRLRYFPEWPEREPKMTFRERLNEMIAEKSDFPCFFATTEY